ncbi:MAG: hypothetical protein LBS03_05860 [Bacteroidales bacterium]|nr:hypothetical protein [Bacteroidales bacterium]
MKIIFPQNGIFWRMLGPIGLFILFASLSVIIGSMINLLQLVLFIILAVLSLPIIAFIRLRESKAAPVDKILWTMFIFFFQLIRPVVLLTWHRKTKRQLPNP